MIKLCVQKPSQEAALDVASLRHELPGCTSQSVWTRDDEVRGVTGMVWITLSASLDGPSLIHSR